MKKVLYIVPHLSTGGLPQYTLKLIETMTKNYEIYCIEHADITGGLFVVQRNKIKNILGNNFFSLTHVNTDIHEIIKTIDPDIIHFQEIPQSFITSNDLDKIYSNERNYKIVVTTHGSQTNPTSIVYGADKYVLVSEWSKNIFVKEFGDNLCDIWEYPIEYVDHDKKLAKKELAFDLNYKHVLNVGLFTPGKNQKELINLAKKLKEEKIIFHFVGNQAINFKDYWEPIMENLPTNCIWHGERSDVEKFYMASDAFYFTSNLELNPLVVKEALSYKLPTFIKKLETYGNEYDGKVNYIVEDDSDNIKKLMETLNMIDDKKEKKIIATHILTDIDSEREVTSMISLSKLENYGMEYVPCVNRRYTNLPPKETCQYPEKISFNSGGTLTPAHYGCYIAHKNAIMYGIEHDADYILVFECDAAIDVSYNEFIEKINIAFNKLNETDLLMFSLGYHNNTNIIEKNKEYWVVNKFYGAHAYVIPKKSFSIFIDLYENEKWNVTDLLYSEKLNKFGIGIFEKPITKQVSGFSILDKVYHEDRY